MFKAMLKKIESYLRSVILSLIKENSKQLNNVLEESTVGEFVKISPPCQIVNCSIGSYTYIAESAIISQTRIGKFCSIGPRVIIGYGIHPTNGISTSPMFYSTYKQNGMTLSSTNKIVERKEIVIGNDVFIGMNALILDGITIGDGAIVGAGAVVTHDVPPYAIVVGCPGKVVKYRFEQEVINKLLKLKWWDWPAEKLPAVERDFFDINKFISEHDFSK